MDDPVQAQLDAYNARDVDAFLRCYVDHCVVEDANGNELMRGHAQMRVRYTALFSASPHLNATVTSRIRVGDHVIDDERITGRVSTDGAPPLRHAVAIYRLHNGLIDHVRFYRE